MKNAYAKLALSVWIVLSAIGGGVTLHAEPPVVEANPQSRELLADRIAPFYRVWSGETQKFSCAIDANIKIKDRVEPVTVRIAKFDDASFDFIATHPDYSLECYRRDDVTALALPKHGRTFVGTGTVSTPDTLAPKDMSTRLASDGSQIGLLTRTIGQADARSLVSLVAQLLKIEQVGEGPHWRFGGRVDIEFVEAEDTKRLRISSGENNATMTLVENFKPADASAWTQYEQVAVPRNEMETQFARGIRRAWEVVWPSSKLTHPRRNAKQVEHGELKFVADQRLVILSGTPDQVGAAHGELLGDESQRCIDSVLHMFGSVQTVATGRWFRHELAAAYRRLRPHIPEDHIAETRALAVSLGQDPQLLVELNVFPEMFHCSGFAVFDSATVGGKLYHGRVLDYMTTIGLQDAATTFVVSIDGKIPFANIGYAGFTGSVSGMNLHSISLGEMGGGGEGKWDGVPMATLMRRSLEECSTLEQVKTLWSSSPRTCEYYYVFADGKTNDAVGVAATPEKIEFIQPGEADSRLGDGIKDAVVLSAGSRLETLRSRVIENHGKIDDEKAMWLMSRPVAMSSNLHNVLFVPADGVFYVANASHHAPAAERPYVQYDLHAILGKTLISAP